MKTSVNIPDWLHDECRELAGDAPFGEQVRDALFIALPVWKKDGAETAFKRALKAKMREIDARAAQAAKNRLEYERSRAAKKPAARAKRAPASAPARPPVAGKASRTRAAKPSPPPASPRSRRA